MDRVSSQSKIDCNAEFAKDTPSAHKLSMDVFESCFKNSNRRIRVPLMYEGESYQAPSANTATYPANHLLTELYMSARKASAKVATSDGKLGTAFFISEDGDMATDFHVVKNNASVSVRTDDGNTRRADVIAKDPKNDVAVLRVQKLHRDEKFKPVAIAPFDFDNASSHQFFACGFGNREEMHCSPGRFKGIKLQRDIKLVDPAPYLDPNRQLAWLNQHTTRGDSGGLIFNLKDKTVTLLVGMTDSFGITLATPAQRLIELHIAASR